MPVNIVSDEVRTKERIVRYSYNIVGFIHET